MSGTIENMTCLGNTVDRCTRAPLNALRYNWGGVSGAVVALELLKATGKQHDITICEPAEGGVRNQQPTCRSGYLLAPSLCLIGYNELTWDREGFCSLQRLEVSTSLGIGGEVDAVVFYSGLPSPTAPE